MPFHTNQVQTTTKAMPMRLTVGHPRTYRRMLTTTTMKPNSEAYRHGNHRTPSPASTIPVSPCANSHPRIQLAGLYHLIAMAFTAINRKWHPLTQCPAHSGRCLHMADCQALQHLRYRAVRMRPSPQARYILVFDMRHQGLHASQNRMVMHYGSAIYL